MLHTKPLHNRLRSLTQSFAVLLLTLLAFSSTSWAQLGEDYTSNANTSGTPKVFSDGTLWPASVPPDSSNVTIDNAYVSLDSDKVFGTLNITGGSVILLNGYTITILDQLLNNNVPSAIDAGTSTVILKSTVADGGSGVVTIGGTNPVTLYNVEVADGSVVDFDDGVSSTETFITNQLKMGGGSVVVNPPNYGGASTLLYDATYASIGTEWTAGASSGKGVPHHVAVGAGGTLSFGSTPNNYTCTGDFSINDATGSVDLSSMMGDLTVKGDFTSGTSSAVTVTVPSVEGKGTITVEGDMTLESNTTWTGDESNVVIKGNLANNISGTAFGLLKFAGASDQDITGNKITVDSLVVANTQNDTADDTDVDFQADVDITPGGVFNPIEGTTKVTGTFTMNSDATGTARIATLADAGATSDVDGNITFERYVPSTASTTWLIMGNYVTTSPAMTVQNWMDDFGGTIYVYSHDETVNATNGNSGANGWTFMNASSSLSTSAEGYFSMVPTSLGTSGHTLSNTGTYTTSSVSPSLTHTSGSYSQYFDPAGWNLLVNPYPSPIDGDAFVANNASVSEYYIYDNTSGNWLSSSQTGALEAPDAIDIGQGFYAYVASGNEGLASFTTDLACYGANTFTRSEDLLLDGMFAVKIEDNEGRFGASTIRFHGEGTSEYEAALDAPFKAGANYNPRIFSQLSDATKLAVNTVGDLNNLPENISLTVQTGMSSVVTIGLDETTAVPEGLCARLIDLELGTVVPFGADELTVELEPFTTYENRFILEFLFVPEFEQTATLCEGGTIHFIGESTEEWSISWDNGSMNGTGCATNLDPGTYELNGVNMLNGCVVQDEVEISEVCMGDFNHNGGRDIPDLLTLLVEMQGASNANETFLHSDCDCDGLITTSDLLMFLPYFGASCE